MADPVTTGAGGVVVDTEGVVSEAPSEESRPTSVIPRDGFHDTREVEAAERGGLPSNQGLPLHPAAREKLNDLAKTLDGLQSWVDHGRSVLAQVEAIGTGR